MLMLNEAGDGFDKAVLSEVKGALLSGVEGLTLNSLISNSSVLNLKPDLFTCASH